MFKKITKVVALMVALGSQPAWAEDAPSFAPGRAFLEKHCLKCHSANEAKAELALDSHQDMLSVVKSRKAFENVMRMVTSGEMPPADEARPDTKDAEAFVDLVKSIFQYADRHAQPDPGRVTMRRLNRVEYRNTIRDLIGVDYDPTQDFPSDDIGHGFDNIGDVLTLSPVLMERYLSAAEGIMQRAIVPDLPKPTQRHTSTRYVEPASPEVEQRLMRGHFRRLKSDAKQSIESGPLFTAYQWTDDGEYVFRSKVFAVVDTPEDLKIRLAIMVQGKELENPSSESDLEKIVGKTRSNTRIIDFIEVIARSEETTQAIELKIPAMRGRDKLLVGLEKLPEGSPPVQLYVEHFALEGPLDMRPAAQQRLLAVTANQTVEQQTQEVLNRFMRQAYRRPATDSELSRMQGLVMQQVAAGQKWEAAMQMAMEAILCSPKLLFRVELDDRPESPEPRQLDEFQLASRLSYFLWSSMPDETLLSLAERGELTNHLDEQVKRMLTDDKSKALVQQFAIQWLQIQRLNTFAPDPQLFPSFNDQLRRAMLTETELFFSSVMKEDRSILDLIDADYTFLNDTLARHYGITPSESLNAEFRRVPLGDRRRGGLMTQASILTVTSNPTRTSPVKRGRWVLEQMLGAPPPPPPPNVPELENSDQAKASGSLKERLEIHRRNPSCANCHAKMDPIGFALENYDAVGAYRTKDGQFDVDPSGQFSDGREIRGPEGLKEILRERKTDFARCLVEKLLTYALGRGLEYYDRPVVERITLRLSENEYRFSVLVGEIVRSEPFRMRRNRE